MSDPGCPRLPLARYPGMNRFVLDWLAKDPRALRFLPRAGETLRLPLRRTSPDETLVHALEDSNRHWGIFAGDELRQWATGQTATIIAGQQVGFAGGPLYTLAKIASLVRMKRDLAASGIAVTLFFWLATEDHDFDEVAQLSIPVRSIAPQRDVNRQLDLLCIRQRAALDSRVAVGPLPIPEPLIRELTSLYDMPRPPWLREGITFRDSFAELLGAAFGGQVILVDALLPELRRAGSSLLVALRQNFDRLQEMLRASSAGLAAAGYTPQVAPREADRYTLLFKLAGDGTREIVDGDAEALAPEAMSTSALTRPLLQDAVFQPDVFIGGPAEVAYYAQLAGVHEHLGIRAPRVALRGHALVAEKRVVRYFSRFGIAPEEIFGDSDEILAAREPEGVAAIESAADAAMVDLMKQIEKINELALPADHSLARSIARSVGHIEYHFGKLKQRAIRGLARKNRDRTAAVRELVATFYPDRQVQDRVVAWWPWWEQFGIHLVDRVIDEIEPDTDSFKLISL